MSTTSTDAFPAPGRRRPSAVSDRSRPATNAPPGGLAALPLAVVAGLGAVAVLLAVPAPAVAQEAAPAPDLEERTATVHDEALVWDGHNDLPWRIRDATGLALEPMNLERRLDEGHTDLVRLREGGVDAQFWSVYVPADDPYPTATILEEIDVVKRLAARYPAHLGMAYTADDVVRVAASGRTASLLGAEGGHAIGNSLPVLRELYRAGVRYMTVTHSGTLAWADAAGDTPAHGGLTDFGRKVIREMNRLGMLVDLSHVTDDVMHDALDVSRAPVIFSHSSVRALAEHPRNVPDDVLRRLPENGGVIMVTFVSAYLTPEGARIDLRGDSLAAALEAEGVPEDSIDARMDRFGEENPLPRGDVGTVADHIDHVVEVAGVDHVGIGSDWDGVTVLPEGLGDVAGFSNLTRELLRRGYSEVEVEKILGGNVLRVLREAEATATNLAGETPPVDRLPHRGPGLEGDGGGDG
jgi:membrane dipeptidase